MGDAFLGMRRPAGEVRCPAGKPQAFVRARPNKDVVLGHEEVGGDVSWSDSDRVQLGSGWPAAVALVMNRAGGHHPFVSGVGGAGREWNQPLFADSVYNVATKRSALVPRPPGSGSSPPATVAS